MPASEQGVDRQRYMLVPRTLTFLASGDKVLLLKGAQNKRLWPGLYNGIGGHVEQGEDILTAARRELTEEAGLAPDTLWLCGTITVDTQTNPGVCVFVFKGEHPVGDPIASTEGTLEWLSYADAQQLALVADLYELLPKIREMEPGQPPFSAHSRYNAKGELVITFV